MSWHWFDFTWSQLKRKKNKNALLKNKTQFKDFLIYVTPSYREDLKKISLLILSIFCLYYDHLGSVTALSTAFFYLLMLQIACVPLLFQTNSMPLFEKLVCHYFDPIQKGLSVGCPTRSPPQWTELHRQPYWATGAETARGHTSPVASELWSVHYPSGCMLETVWLLQLSK